MSQCSSLSEQGHFFHKVSDDDNTSDCSTLIGEDTAAQHEDLLSDCSSNASPEVESLLIFDWDDTLFPTSWLMKHDLCAKGKTLSAEQEVQLRLLAESARMTLQKAAQTGKVVIITNAEQGWIEKSCTKFMPSLAPLLKTVDMVSARSTYQQVSEDPSEWKRLAFEYEVDLFYGSGDAGQLPNIVSVGDSMHELNALKSVTKGMANSRGKSIKLLECPSIEQLIEQHEVLSGSLLEIAEHDGDLDVAIGAE